MTETWMQNSSITPRLKKYQDSVQRGGGPEGRETLLIEVDSHREIICDQTTC